jgi:hypothetical protein
MRANIFAILSGLVLICGTILPSQSWSQNAALPTPIGKVVSSTGAVTIEHGGAVVVQANLPGQPSRTKIGDPVFMGDVVQTGADGRVGITFTDGTAFNLTSNARMVLNEFVYDPNSKSNSTLFSLTKGTFTFVAGKVAKTGDMKIETPVATMGIRGTTPRVEISDDGTVKFTTLVEEGKNKIDKNGASPKQRQARGVSGQQPAPQSTTRIDRPNLTICRGC